MYVTFESKHKHWDTHICLLWNIQGCCTAFYKIKWLSTCTSMYPIILGFLCNHFNIHQLYWHCHRRSDLNTIQSFLIFATVWMCQCSHLSHDRLWVSPHISWDILYVIMRWVKSPTTVTSHLTNGNPLTVYPKKYAHGFVVLCFVVVMQSFIMNSHEVFIHIHQGCFAGTGAIVRLPQCQWSKPDGYGKISQCITTTKHSKAKTVCIFLGIYCTCGTESALATCGYLGANQFVVCGDENKTLPIKVIIPGGFMVSHH